MTRAPRRRQRPALFPRHRVVGAVEAEERGAVIAVEAVGAGGAEDVQHLRQRRALGVQPLGNTTSAGLRPKVEPSFRI